MFVALDVEQRVPTHRPLRAVKTWCDEVLASMGGEFDRAYGTGGQVSVPPELLFKAFLRRALFGIPSERRLCEACDTDYP